MLLLGARVICCTTALFCIFTNISPAIPSIKTNPSCHPFYFSCDITKCIAPIHVCNGKADCHDASDESFDACFAKATRCNDSSFHCQSSGECIKHAKRCDGKADCDDRSDEEDCPLIPKKCHGFICESKRCIPRNNVCNGVRDCDHGEDEANCKFQCDDDLFRCGELHQCINRTQVCDQIVHCKNAADEPNICGINECLTRRNCCDQNCHDLPIGYNCSCYDGYILNADLYTCEDVNECLQIGICSQHCENLEGSFNCFCNSGYKISGRTQCKAKGENMFFLFSQNNSIFRYAPDELLPPETIINNVKSVVAITYHAALQLVYWSDVTTHQILRVNLRTPYLIEAIINNTWVPDCIAIDWIGNKLYWVDGLMKHIEVSELDGSYQTVLLSSGLNNPKSIAVDPRVGYRYLYWCDWGKEGKIEQISLDGDITTRMIIYARANHWPKGLVIDFPASTLIWMDDKSQTIESMEINGDNHRKFDILHTPYSMGVFEDNVYWVGLNVKGIHWLNKFSGKMGVLYQTANYVPHLSVFHKVLQTDAPLPEGDIQCSHLKLLSHRYGFKCACPSPYSLLEDGKTCNIGDIIPRCHSKFCEHGGVCFDKINEIKVLPKCHCTRNFNGSRCETKIELLNPVFKIVQYKCVDEYCYNGGCCEEFKVSLNPRKPICHCLEGYHGRRCQFYHGYMLNFLEKKLSQGSVHSEPTPTMHVFRDSSNAVLYGIIAFGSFAMVCIFFLLVSLHMRRSPRSLVFFNPNYMSTGEDISTEDGEVHGGLLVEPV